MYLCVGCEATIRGSQDLGKGTGRRQAEGRGGDARDGGHVSACHPRLGSVILA
jgi:hypothetical protein